MPKTNFSTEKEYFSVNSDGLNENSLSELSSDEASEIMGGFTIRNDSGSTRRFFIFGAFLDPEVQLLQPGETGDYDGEYILYNSSRTSFSPTLSSRINPDDALRFERQGNKIAIGPGFAFSLANGPA
ncbi:MAG: hypothetical protein RMX96_23130 [Nostoc sp. ChiSLP02]|nr:hypothetical protein [Nostoc sp. DedSLP05]MDZ8103284.1 hypothetical protein [Nostoc sp. DedSLP01]MDZ8187732.1 hypothetical protein [Nostoc sp. ChiSLP02]